MYFLLFFSYIKLSIVSENNMFNKIEFTKYTIDILLIYIPINTPMYSEGLFKLNPNVLTINIIKYI